MFLSWVQPHYQCGQHRAPGRLTQQSPSNVSTPHTSCHTFFVFILHVSNICFWIITAQEIMKEIIEWNLRRKQKDKAAFAQLNLGARVPGCSSYHFLKKSFICLLKMLICNFPFSNTWMSQVFFRWLLWWDSCVQQWHRPGSYKSWMCEERFIIYLK